MRILFLCIMTFIISIDCIGKNIYDEPSLLIEANRADFIAKNEKASNFYSERIVLIKKKEVEQYLKMEINNRYFYQFPNIFLIEK